MRDYQWIDIFWTIFFCSGKSLRTIILSAEITVQTDVCVYLLLATHEYHGTRGFFFFSLYILGRNYESVLTCVLELY